MNDMDLCSGVGCAIKQKCKRYIEQYSADELSWWVDPKCNNGACPNLIEL